MIEKYIVASKLKDYFQPPAGNTERYISLEPISVVSGVRSTFTALKKYHIANSGVGLPAVEKLIDIIFKRQFKTDVVWDKRIWTKTVVISVECCIRNRKDKKSFAVIKPKTIHDIDEEFAKNEGQLRCAEIVSYAKKMKKRVSLANPLYITGTVLNSLGAGTNGTSLYMVDGAKRIVANALTHKKTVVINLVLTEDEFAGLLNPKSLNHLKEKLLSQQWFNNYQAITLLGLKGQRGEKRYELMDFSVLQNRVVFDFGCNVGQSCIKAIQAGAKTVVGFDSMKDSIMIAKDIKAVLGFDSIYYSKLDFNSSRFEETINKRFPFRPDYSFFFSVYRTKELTQRERLFRYIIKKTRIGIFFEGHAHPKIDTIEYYDWLFETMNLPYTFLGYAEENVRPLFYLDVTGTYRQPSQATPQKEYALSNT